METQVIFFIHSWISIVQILPLEATIFVTRKVHEQNDYHEPHICFHTISKKHHMWHVYIMKQTYDLNVYTCIKRRMYIVHSINKYMPYIYIYLEINIDGTNTKI